MDNDSYTSDISKGSCPPICYSIGCDNPATTTVKIPLNQSVSCLIQICDNCLPKYPNVDDVNRYDRSHHPQNNEEQKQ